MLKNPDQEHILLINEKGEYELVPYDQMKDAVGGNVLLRAFVFERCGARYVVYWHSTGSARLFLPLRASDVTVSDTLGGTPLTPEVCDGGIAIPADNRRYLKTSLSRADIVKAFAAAKLL